MLFPPQSSPQQARSSPKLVRPTSDLTGVRKICRSESSSSGFPIPATSFQPDVYQSTVGITPPSSPPSGGGRLIRMVNSETRLTVGQNREPKGSLDQDHLSSSGSGVEISDFCLIKHSDADENIYLFARTSREKEAWFRRLHGASVGQPLLTTTQMVVFFA